MHLDISRQKRVGRPGDPPAYVVAASLQVSGQESKDIQAHGLSDYELETDEEDEEAEVIPVGELIVGREFPFETAREAIDFEETLVAACSEFAQSLIDSLEFGGRDTYELPLEEADDDDDE